MPSASGLLRGGDWEVACAQTTAASSQAIPDGRNDLLLMILSSEVPSSTLHFLSLASGIFFCMLLVSSSRFLQDDSEVCHKADELVLLPGSHSLAILRGCERLGCSAI
jgi:hypothetical protein